MLHFLPIYSRSGNHGWSNPETLAKTSGVSLETEALAGSAPRGFSAGKDAHWGKTLLGREKDLREHQLVIESIKRRLSSIGLNDCEEGKITLAQACESATHQNPLACQVTCRRPPIRRAFGPPPDACHGRNPKEVRPFARPQARGLPRGWYSGVTGWLDSKGRENSSFPFAVEKSGPTPSPFTPAPAWSKDPFPNREKIETDWKLQAMLEVITGKTTLSGE